MCFYVVSHKKHHVCLFVVSNVYDATQTFDLDPVLVFYKNGRRVIQSAEILSYPEENSLQQQSPNLLSHGPKS